MKEKEVTIGEIDRESFIGPCICEDPIERLDRITHMFLSFTRNKIVKEEIEATGNMLITFDEGKELLKINIEIKKHKGKRDGT